MGPVLIFVLMIRCIVLKVAQVWRCGYDVPCRDAKQYVVLCRLASCDIGRARLCSAGSRGAMLRCAPSVWLSAASRRYGM